MISPSVHDLCLLGYEVDGTQRRIRFRIGDTHNVERVLVEFRGVEAYRFEHDNFGNIIFGIDELSLDRFLDLHTAELKAGVQHAWPGVWNTSIDACREQLEVSNTRIWIITSSYGLSGWVAAVECLRESACPTSDDSC